MGALAGGHGGHADCRAQTMLSPFTTMHFREPGLDRGASRLQMPRIERIDGLPYFVTSAGQAWTPIGHNDAICWPELAGLFCRRGLPDVKRHLCWLKDHGVTCLRVMLEYAQGRHRYIERTVGHFVPNVVRLWDDLFALCEELGLYLLLTPFDTFFTWRHWKHHPYNRANGGPAQDRRPLITCAATREAIKRRFEFATRRWGGSPALFAWDLWNELHPAHGEDDPAACASFVSDISQFLRALERRVHGRAHLQTVSVFGPELTRTPSLGNPVYRHPGLDFVNTHLYESGTIDDPRDTVTPALAVGRLMRAAIEEASPMRPVFDSEHGPIHAFIDRHRVLPDTFDDEYFRHMQWAHLASGGVGGGMRWPNRQSAQAHARDAAGTARTRPLRVPDRLGAIQAAQPEHRSRARAGFCGFCVWRREPGGGVAVAHRHAGSGRHAAHRSDTHRRACGAARARRGRLPSSCSTPALGNPLRAGNTLTQAAISVSMACT
jgi:hypothetical protein